jgi:predicted phosphodiesterase
MLHAIVSDVHANLEALGVVLADIERRGVAEVVCLGDLVGYGASPNECMSTLCPRLAAVVLGNHDQATIEPAMLANFNHEAATAARWTRKVLSRVHADWLAALPLSVAWRGAQLVHASPAVPAEWNYVFTPEDAVDEMSNCEEPVCFVGHSHYPGTFEVAGQHGRYTREAIVAGRRDCRYLIVVPSVGQPRDGDPRTGYLLWDDVAWKFEHVRLAYDFEQARARILAAGLPTHLGDRLRVGE